jgi:hypothetical protein
MNLYNTIIHEYIVFIFTITAKQKPKTAHKIAAIQNSKPKIQKSTPKNADFQPATAEAAPNKAQKQPTKLHRLPTSKQ